MKNLETLLKWETHLSRRFYAYRDAGGARPNFDFRTGDSTWFIERNHYGLPVYMTGVADDDVQKKRLGDEVLRYGIERQCDDGSFPCEDVHHSAAFFFESLARFVALGELTRAGDLTPHRECLRKGISWFRRRTTWNNDDWWCDSKHHRFFLNAASCFMASELLYDRPDIWLQEQAYAWMAEGLRRQRPDGAHTEMGGIDTAYHSCSVLYGAVVLMTCTLQPTFTGDLRESLARACRWLLRFIGDDGRIDASQNSRTGPTTGETNRETGSQKDHKPHETAFALYGAGLALEEQACLDAADRIMSVSASV